MTGGSTRIIAAAALAGVATLMLQPPPPALADDTLETRLVLLAQPALLTVAMLWAGAKTAPKVGLGTPWLDQWLARTRVRRPPAGRAIIFVAAAAAAMILGAANISGHLLTNVAALPAPPLVTRLWYGGVTEEVISRWGVMSFFAWLAMRWLPGVWPYRLAMAFAAAIFAAGHLPLLYELIPSPPRLLVGTLFLGNALAGMGFGWLYWRHGLEAAMCAHALAHLLAWMASRS